MKANTLKDIPKTFAGTPLSIEEMAAFYVETSEARGSKIRARLKIALEESMNLPQHLLLVGHTGCGKSTELNKMQQELTESKDFFVFKFSVKQELNISNFNYLGLIIALMSNIFEAAGNKENGFKISKAYLENIENWWNTKEIVAIRERNLDSAIGSEGLQSIPLVGGLFKSLTGQARLNIGFQQQLKRTEDQPLSKLTDLCNDLLAELLLEVKANGYNDILVIIEDLDKIDNLIHAEEFFDVYSEQLTSLNTNIIYTFPIGLYYHSKANNITQKYSDCFELPMIKVLEKNSQVYDANGFGPRELTAIISHRMEMDLFEDSRLVQDFIVLSGGCLRDLFLMIKEASICARIEGFEKIKHSHLIKAKQKLAKSYRNALTDTHKPNGLFISAKTYHETLAIVANHPNKNPENTDALMDLRQNLSVLTYNGEGWCDVHPILKDLLFQRHEITAELLPPSAFKA